MQRKIKDTPESLQAKVNRASAAAKRDPNFEAIVPTTKEMIQHFMGPDYKEDYFMMSGVRVIEQSIDIDALLEHEEKSIESINKSF